MPRIPTIRLAVAVTAVALGVSLAGCTSSAGSSSTPSASASSVSAACVSSGSASDSVKVSGAFDTAPTVSFAAPLKVSTTQRTVVIDGKGAKAKPGSLVDVSFTLYNGTDGKTVTSTGYGAGRASAITVDASQVISGLVKTLNCAQAGTRVVGVLPASEAFGSAGSSSLGIAPNQVIVIVADVVSLVPTKASGQKQPAVDGLPTVKLASDGKPTLVVPKGYAPPATTTIATLIKGKGAVVGATDTVVIQYQGTNLKTGKIFDQTWGRSPYSGAVNGFVPGFTKAIVGQTVGSQVLVLIAPADGYGPQGGNSGAGIGKDDTIAFVVDVLSTETPAAG
ncbi:FKBP-type peptidyl-prolyl cis-trans isomerase [Lysinimonas soli]|uniref:peptidylprolyl isomerase n=1 Tax=Lysinimonas soli TaxID=1074233 RepID=A0ABW0NLP2_9MICO